MARNRSTNRRRRRGRFSFLTKLLCILLIAGAVVAALTVFFKVQSITVGGNARYTSEEIVAASGIEIEDNLFLLNKYSAAQAIFEKLPYVEEATINRALPDTIVITVRECAAAAGVVTPEGYWLISENGKLLEQTDTLPSGCPGITGVVPDAPALSAQLSLGEEKTLTTETLLTLVRTAGGYGMLAGIGSVDLSDAEAITFTYLGRFTVRLPWDSDLDYIFRSVQDLVNGLESNETGEINYMLLKSKGEMHFIPSAPGELRGDFDLTRDLGLLYANTECGIFGVLPQENRPEAVGEAIPVARRTEVRTGKAVILANCRGDEVCAYEIEIEKLYGGSAPTRNLLLRVTDPALIALTGGIVQGMSGSPIVQDGKLVGAVTHVLLDDPQRGYGILAENMLSASGMTAQSAASA